MHAVNIILDTDIGPDCDDAGAVAVLHTLAAHGEARIAGMMHCTSSRWGAGCLDAINAYYECPDIPIGTLSQPDFLAHERYETYNKALALQYDNRYRGEHPAPDAIQLYRRLLAEAEDASIVIAAIGPLRNLAGLLRSEPDAISPLPGIRLVERKVKETVAMGGHFPFGREWNFEMAPDAARLVAAEWPTPIIFAGYEIGSAVLTGRSLLATAPSQHPVRQAYERFGLADGVRPSWDLIAVMVAVRGLRDGWRLSERGRVLIEPDGANRWMPGEGSHRYLIFDTEPAHIEHLLEQWLVGKIK
ncbi:nucleoside hydrolase [Cohnella hashimotonis]|uniref:Nucleoside hydrolase n=1 Tax=Cohnella hashimotonis TaxID=2826895 RepID=A0ABT6TKC5_9BACL|nr:nucleoside hydrolase [Cohnella hashimotonis]